MQLALIFPVVFCIVILYVWKLIYDYGQIRHCRSGH